MGVRGKWSQVKSLARTIPRHLLTQSQPRIPTQTKSRDVWVRHSGVKSGGKEQKSEAVAVAGPRPVRPTSDVARTAIAAQPPSPAASAAGRSPAEHRTPTSEPPLAATTTTTTTSPTAAATKPPHVSEGRTQRSTLVARRQKKKDTRTHQQTLIQSSALVPWSNREFQCYPSFFCRL